jgi:hypothetical protein
MSAVFGTPPSSRGPGRGPLKAQTGVRIPLGAQVTVIFEVTVTFCENMKLPLRKLFFASVYYFTLARKRILGKQGQYVRLIELRLETW